MITSLSIKNYALINDITVSFDKGLTTITGETGAGKSILLGALSLLLGKRADLTSVKNTDKKCVIEGVFALKKYALQDFFEQQDLDYEPTTIIRREILPSGKSRAFVNDTPVVLNSLSALGKMLIDIHSQHQTLEVASEAFQFRLVDALANTSQELKTYTQHREEYLAQQKQLQQLKDNKADFEKELDYNTFLYEELKKANLKPGEQAALEEEFETLNNVETIFESLSNAIQRLQTEETGALDLLRDTQQNLQRIASFAESYKTMADRLQSVQIELDDIVTELETMSTQLEADPNRLEVVNTQLQQRYTLQKKHQVSSEEELIAIQNELEQKIDVASSVDEEIKKTQKALQHAEQLLEESAEELHAKRKAVLPKLKQQLETMLKDLGLPNAQFDLRLEDAEQYTAMGKDTLAFLFTANKGMPFGPLKKVASGGEMSRIMLVIKAILARHTQLPTIIFDEIDTGVSGEVARKMADILADMGNAMQVISITHLPQIAAKGKQHFKVYKQDIEGITTTQLTQLNAEERIVELAEMLGGEQKSDVAVAHAKELLN